MAVTKVSMRWGSDLSGDQIRESYIVHVDDPQNDNVVLVQRAQDPTTGKRVPIIGDRHPKKSSLSVKQHPRVTQEQCGTIYYVEAVYEAASPNDPIQGSTSDRPKEDKPGVDVTISWSSEIITEQVEQDINGLPLQNTVGEKYDMMQQFRVEVLEIGRIEENWNHKIIKEFIDTVSLDPIYGYKTREALMDDIRGTPLGDGTTQAFYRIKFRDGGWDRRILNAGYRELFFDQSVEPAPGAWITREILDVDGVPVSKPYPLTKDGRRVDPERVAGNKTGTSDAPRLPAGAIRVPGEGIDADGLYWQEFRFFADSAWFTLNIFQYDK